VVRRVMLGNLPNGYGLRVSKPGYDVIDTEAGNLLIDSTSAGFLRQRSNYTLSFSSASTQYIAHNLGVIPIVLWSLTDNTTGESQRLNTSLTIWASSSQIAVSTRISTSQTVYLQLLTEII